MRCEGGGARFFLVSGYSIAASLRRYPTGFYTRRLLRIYPIYLLTIVCAFILERAINGDLVMPGDEVFHPSGIWVAIANLFFLQTFIVKPIGFDIPVWSLAIEVAYYLAAPFLARLPKWTVLALIGVSAVSFASPRNGAAGPIYYLFTHFNMLTYAWAWMMGFYFYTSRHWAIVIGFAALGSVVIRLNTYLNPEPYAVATYLGALALVVIAAEGWAALAARAAPHGDEHPGRHLLPVLSVAIPDHSGGLRVPGFAECLGDAGALPVGLGAGAFRRGTPMCGGWWSGRSRVRRQGGAAGQGRCVPAGAAAGDVAAAVMCGAAGRGIA